MKPCLRILFFAFNLVLWTLLIFGTNTAFSQMTQNVNFSPGTYPVSPSVNIIQWIGSNWAVIALVISEAAALLPNSVNGIVHGVIRAITAFFQKA